VGIRSTSTFDRRTTARSGTPVMNHRSHIFTQPEKRSLESKFAV
jgi:hypothetical protein